MVDEETVSKIEKAINNDDIETLDKIISDGFDINEEFMINSSENTILFYAAQNCRIKSLEWALSKGAYVNFKDRNGNTALILASFEGHTEVVKALMSKCSKATINIRNNDKNTALILASSSGKNDVVALLLKKCNEATIHIRNNNGNTALILAYRNGHTEIQKMITDKLESLNRLKEIQTQIDQLEKEKKS